MLLLQTVVSVTIVGNQMLCRVKGGSKVKRRGLCSAGSWPWVKSTETPAKLEATCPKTKQRCNVTKLVERNPHLSEQARDCRGQVEEKTWLPTPPDVSRPRAVHNAAALAYLGDAIYEVYIRRHFLTPPQSIEMYNNRVQALACCEAQDALLKKLVREKILTDEERDVLRWGRNVKMGHKRATRRAGTSVYNSASSLETLLGYLYLRDPARLEQMMSILGLSGDAANGWHVDASEDIVPPLGEAEKEHAETGSHDSTNKTGGTEMVSLK